MAHYENMTQLVKDSWIESIIKQQGTFSSFQERYYIDPKHRKFAEMVNFRVNAIWYQALNENTLTDEEHKEMIGMSSKAIHYIRYPNDKLKQLHELLWEL